PRPAPAADRRYRLRGFVVSRNVMRLCGRRPARRGNSPFGGRERGGRRVWPAGVANSRVWFKLCGPQAQLAISERPPRGSSSEVLPVARLARQSNVIGARVFEPGGEEMATEHIRHWQIGDVQVTRIVEVNAHEDPFTMLSVECEPDMAKHYPWLAPNFATPDGRMKISFQAVALKALGKTVIVDTCIGEGRVREFDIFTNMQSDYLEDLAAAGYDPEEVDAVLCTHLH